MQNALMCTNKWRMFCFLTALRVARFNRRLGNLNMKLNFKLRVIIFQRYFSETVFGSLTKIASHTFSCYVSRQSSCVLKNAAAMRLFQKGRSLSQYSCRLGQGSNAIHAVERMKVKFLLILKGSILLFQRVL